MSLTDHTDPAGDAPSAPNHHPGTARWLVPAVVALLCASGLVIAGAAPAGAAPATPKPRDPVASTPKFSVVRGGLAITGWALDPDEAGTNLRVAAVVDGTKTLGASPTSLPNATVTKQYGSGSTPGYSLTVPVATGKHIVCVVLDNPGGGQRVVKRCVATPLGRVLTPSQTARRSPKWSRSQFRRGLGGSGLGRVVVESCQ